jgi:hypothetical protein
MIPNAEEFLDNYIKKENIPWNQDVEKLYGAINAAMIGYGVEILKYNLKQYKMQYSMIEFNGRKLKTIDEITLETIKELEK